MKYRLIFGAVALAEIEEDGSDFPTFFGKVVYLPRESDDKALDRVYRFIDYSIRVWPLMEADQFDDPAFKEEANHAGVINSDDWWLEDDNGVRTPILAPMFCTDGRINWRPDPTRWNRKETSA